MEINIPTIIVGSLGISGGLVSLYVRLTLSNFILTSLNGRYPTKEIFNLKIDALHERITDIHNAINSMPCRHTNSDLSDCYKKQNADT